MSVRLCNENPDVDLGSISPAFSSLRSSSNSGGSAGSFPDQRPVMEPDVDDVDHNEQRLSAHSSLFKQY